MNTLTLTFPDGSQASWTYDEGGVFWRRYDGADYSDTAVSFFEDILDCVMQGGRVTPTKTEVEA